jgi:hypothetical protein
MERISFEIVQQRFAAQLALIVIAVLSLVSFGWSQSSTTGMLKGAVTDPAGKNIAGADIRATDQATHEERSVKSGIDGLYVIPLLPPGNYGIDVEAPGFAHATLTGVVVVVTETTVLNLPLKVGTTSVMVEVKVETPVVETTTTSLGDVVTAEQVESLPLVNRNFTQIMTLSAGVVASVTEADEVGRGSGGEIPTNEGAGENVNGARASDINFRMDGVDVNDYDASGFGVPIPNPDTIQEFKVQTGMYDAEYGRDAGANVNLVTKTGSNSFHGSLFEFWRNDVLNANDFFLNETATPRPELKQNQFGGTIGGPIVKDKLLFFGSYQGTRQINGVFNRQTFYSPLTTNDRSAASIANLFAGQMGLQYIVGPPGFGPAMSFLTTSIPFLSRSCSRRCQTDNFCSRPQMQQRIWSHCQILQISVRTNTWQISITTSRKKTRSRYGFSPPPAISPIRSASALPMEPIYPVLHRPTHRTIS